jgi:HEAT repeat protein
MLAVRLTNISSKPIYYAPTVAYPPAVGLVARITDTNGQVQEARLSNDADGAISGPGGSINPGAFIDVPVMMKPLAAGSYTIQVGKGKSARVTVKEDAELARKWEQDLLEKIRKGNSFARHVVCTYLEGKQPRKSLIDLLLKDLLSDDHQVAERVAWPLACLPELPPNSTAIIGKAMTKQIALVKTKSSATTQVLTSLAGLASTIGTDEALESVLTLAHTHEFRGNAVWALGRFKQQKAAQELRRFLKDESEELRFRSAQLLADRKDPEALEVLLVIAHDPKSQWRMYSFKALLNYPDDPRVELAIKSGMDDRDFFRSAETALRDLRRAKKPMP